MQNRGHSDIKCKIGDIVHLRAKYGRFTTASAKLGYSDIECKIEDVTNLRTKQRRLITLSGSKGKTWYRV